MPDGERSLDALRQAILQALMESGQFTPEMLKALRGETATPARTRRSSASSPSCSTRSSSG